MITCKLTRVLSLSDEVPHSARALRSFDPSKGSFVGGRMNIYFKDTWDLWLGPQKLEELVRSRVEVTGCLMWVGCVCWGRNLFFVCTCATVHSWFANDLCIFVISMWVCNFMCCIYCICLKLKARQIPEMVGGKFTGNAFDWWSVIASISCRCSIKWLTWLPLWPPSQWQICINEPRLAWTAYGSSSTRFFFE